MTDTILWNRCDHADTVRDIGGGLVRYLSDSSQCGAIAVYEVVGPHNPGVGVAVAHSCAFHLDEVVDDLIPVGGAGGITRLEGILT